MLPYFLLYLAVHLGAGISLLTILFRREDYTDRKDFLIGFPGYDPNTTGAVKFNVLFVSACLFFIIIAPPVVIWDWILGLRN